MRRNSSEEFEHSLHTYKVQVLEQLEKAAILHGCMQTTSGLWRMHEKVEDPPLCVAVSLHPCSSSALYLNSVSKFNAQ